MNELYEYQVHDNYGICETGRAITLNEFMEKSLTIRNWQVDHCLYEMAIVKQTVENTTFRLGVPWRC